MQASQGAVFEQMVVRMRAVGDSKTSDARILRHQKVVRGIADHQGRFAGNAELCHQFLEHLRMRLGMAFIGTARGLKQRAQPGMIERPFQPKAALAGGNRQNVAC